MFFARDAASVHFSYRRYLENRLRDEFGFLGTPIRLVFRERATVREPRRVRRSTERLTKREARPAIAVKKGRRSTKRATR